jgi:hypothetical protein
MAVAAIAGRGRLGGVENLLWHTYEPIATRPPGQGLARAGARYKGAGLDTFGILIGLSFSRTAA